MAIHNLGLLRNELVNIFVKCVWNLLKFNQFLNLTFIKNLRAYATELFFTTK